MIRTLLPLLLLMVLHVHASSTDEMEAIRKGTTSPVITAEQLDRYAAQLSEFRPSSESEWQAYLQTQIAIAEGYATINHFKPAYQAYKKYLELKEPRLSEKYNRIVEEALASVKTKDNSLDEALHSAEEEFAGLKNSASNYITLRTYYKRFFALSIITLTFIFAVVLVRSGLRLAGMGKETDAIRSRLKADHRRAAIGDLTDGFLRGQREDFEQASKVAVELHDKIDEVLGSTKDAKTSAIAAHADALLQGVLRLKNQN